MNFSGVFFFWEGSSQCFSASAFLVVSGLTTAGLGGPGVEQTYHLKWTQTCDSQERLCFPNGWFLTGCCSSCWCSRIFYFKTRLGQVLNPSQPSSLKGTQLMWWQKSCGRKTLSNYLMWYERQNGCRYATTFFQCVHMICMQYNIYIYIYIYLYNIIHIYTYLLMHVEI